MLLYDPTDGYMYIANFSSSLTTAIISQLYTYPSSSIQIYQMQVGYIKNQSTMYFTGFSTTFKSNDKNIVSTYQIGFVVSLN